jgi:CDP-glucose 4,6-dehydratase
LAEALIAGEEGAEDAWNFGPADADAQPVSWIADTLTRAWGKGASWARDGDEHPHEAGYLKLDSSKARSRLQWRPRLDLATALQWIVAWHQEYLAGGDLRAATLADIQRYEGLNV